MRIEYSCFCDGCRKVIKLVNDENDVALNSRKLQLCPICFSQLCDMVDGFLATTQKNNGA